MATLFANRRIRHEVAVLNFENMCLDVAFCDLHSSLPQMVQFVDTFKDRLRFVRKLEVPSGVAQSFVFAYPYDDDPEFLGGCPYAKMELFTTRAYFPNVQQVTIYADHKGVTILKDL